MPVINPYDPGSWPIGSDHSPPAGRSVRAIARDIVAHWPKPYFGAVPYIRAMSALERPEDAYGFDSGREIIGRFLCNASAWRGPAARYIKAELKAMIGRKK